MDSVNLTLTLPEDKLCKLLLILRNLQGRRKASRLELERLGGLLAHCAKVIRGGRTFSRRIYDLMGSVRERHYKVRLNEGLREDIAWWLGFARKFNGSASILGKFAAIYSTYSDASKWGFGALHGGDWLAGNFMEKDNDTRGYLGHHYVEPEARVRLEHINVQEMWAAYAAASRWSERWANANIVMVTDSSTVLAALCTGRSRSKQIMHYIRRLFWLAIERNFVFSAVYIRSAENVICDALSRLDKDDSSCRLLDADPGGILCCRDIFSESLSSYRRRVSRRAEGIPGAGICAQLGEHQGSPGEEVPGVHRRIRG